MSKVIGTCDQCGKTIEEGDTNVKITRDFGVYYLETELYCGDCAKDRGLL